MKKIETKVVHSEKNSAWNIIGTEPGRKYKIARIPYISVENDEIIHTKHKSEALEHALFINRCFNNADKIEKE